MGECGLASLLAGFLGLGEGGCGTIALALCLSALGVERGVKDGELVLKLDETVNLFHVAVLDDVQILHHGEELVEVVGREHQIEEASARLLELVHRTDGVGRLEALLRQGGLDVGKTRLVVRDLDHEVVDLALGLFELDGAALDLCGKLSVSGRICPGGNRKRGAQCHGGGKSQSDQVSCGSMHTSSSNGQYDDT